MVVSGWIVLTGGGAMLASFGAYALEKRLSPNRDEFGKGDLDFNAASEAAEDGLSLVIDIEGYEGPLHLLLALARSRP